MSKSPILRHVLTTFFLCTGLLVCLALTGCQVETGGQTLPSPYYMQDDVQYYPPGPEFKLAREAAAMKASSQQQPQTSAPSGQ